MAALQQVVKFSVEEVKNILIEKAKEVVSDGGGKQIQGKSVASFDVANGNDATVNGATVTFDRAGK
jgi:hypothetical protein